MNTLKLDGEGTQDMSRAVALLQQGQLVAMPTETVYGLAADARNEQAVNSLFKVKQRPAAHPLIVHIGDVAQLSDWAVDIPPLAYELAAHLWPGPLTLVLKKAPDVLPCVTGGQHTIAVRIPAHPVAQALLTQFGSGLVAPSANKYGRVSPTAAAHVLAEFESQIAAVIDGGLCQFGIESSIVDLSSSQARVLRPGILDQQIASHFSVVGYQQQAPASVPRVSGQDSRHYAPTKPAYLYDPQTLAKGISQAKTQHKVQVWSLTPNRFGIDGIDWVVMPLDATFYARELYLRLHDFEQSDRDLLIIEQPPLTASWRAINNRLMRACEALVSR